MTDAPRRLLPRYFLPLPVASVALVAAVLASQVLGVYFPVFDDGDLRIEIRVDQIVRRHAGDGLLMGKVSVANLHPFDILVTGVRLTLLSGTVVDGTFQPHADPVRFETSLPSSGYSFHVPSGHTIRNRGFVGALGGDLALLQEGDTVVRVTATIDWVEVHARGDLRPMSRSVDTLCANAVDVLLAGGVGASTCASL